MKIVNKVSFAIMMLSLLGAMFFGMALDSPSDIPVRMIIIFMVLAFVSMAIYYDSERRM